VAILDDEFIYTFYIILRLVLLIMVQLLSVPEVKKLQNNTCDDDMMTTAITLSVDKVTALDSRYTSLNSTVHFLSA
jgi:hypothetical protein